MEESEADIEFRNNNSAFTFSLCDGGRDLPTLTPQFHCDSGLVFLGFPVGRSPRLFDAFYCVIRGYLEEAVANSMGYLFPNVRQKIQVGGRR